MNRAFTCLAAISLSLTVSAFGEERVNDTIIGSGTTLVITDEAMSDATRSQPGFVIMQGSVPTK